MSVAASRSTSLKEYRALQRELQAELDRLIESTDAASNKGDMDRWSDLRQQQSTVARSLASTVASIAQLETAERVRASHPRRTFSNRVPR